MKKIIKKIKKYLRRNLDTRKMSPGKQEMLLRILCR